MDAAAALRRGAPPSSRRTSPGSVVIEDEALNAEAAPADLDHPITPVASFFIRNNGALPAIRREEARAWTLTIDGEVERPATWTVDALKTAFPVVTVTAVMECAGNGRSDFSPITRGLPWGPGAVGCARWTGVRLRDLLDGRPARSRARSIPAISARTGRRTAPARRSRAACRCERRWRPRRLSPSP